MQLDKVNVLRERKEMQDLLAFSIHNLLGYFIDILMFISQSYNYFIFRFIIDTSFYLMIID